MCEVCSRLIRKTPEPPNDYNMFNDVKCSIICTTASMTWKYSGLSIYANTTEPC